MDVILLERVEKLGVIGDVVTVKDGFARNFLLPRKKALRANEANRKVFEANRARIADLVDRSLMLVTALAPEIGYDNAAKIAKHAHHQGMTLKEAGLDLGLVDSETFDRVVRPETMLGR